MDFISKLAAAPIKELGEAAGNIIDRYVSDPGERAEAQAKIIDARTKSEANAFNYLTAGVNAMRDMWVADSQSDSALTRLWRPITMLVLVGVIVLIVGVDLFTADSHEAFSLKDDLPEEFWYMLMAGLTGTAGFRTVEKVFATARGTKISPVDLSAPRGTRKAARGRAKQILKLKREGLTIDEIDELLD